MRRTLHGEALEERCGGNTVGMRPKRYFWSPRVWCPRCGARPNRRCISLPGDQHLSKAGRLADGLKSGQTHTERSQRADMLNRLRDTSQEALYRLAVKRGADKPPTRATVDPAGLPLFRSSTPA